MPDRETPWEFIPDEEHDDADDSAEELAMHIEGNLAYTAVGPGQFDRTRHLDDEEPEQGADPSDEDRQLDVQELLVRQGYLYAPESQGSVTSTVGTDHQPMFDRRVWEHLQTEQQRLTTLRDDVASHLPVGQTQGERDGELSSMDQHQADMASSTLDIEVDHSLLEQINDELSEVDHAFKRLAAGTYGFCETCHKPIGDERLETLPAARRCILHELSAGRTGPLGAT